MANKLRLLNLDDDVQEALLNEKISERHARSLLKLTSAEQQKQMLEKILRERLTVRRADEEIEKMLKGESSINQNPTFENNNNISESHLEENNDIFKNGFKFINQIQPDEPQKEEQTREPKAEQKAHEKE